MYENFLSISLTDYEFMTHFGKTQILKCAGRLNILHLIYSSNHWKYIWLILSHDFFLTEKGVINYNIL